MLPFHDFAGSGDGEAGFAEEATEAAGADSRIECQGGSCFIAGTLVQMADGSLRPVEQIKTGDRVLSRDPASGTMAAVSVGTTLVHHCAVVFVVTLTDPQTHEHETLVASPEHPFFVLGHGFVPASSLGIGSQIVTRAGPPLTVTAVEQETQLGGYTVYNFVVPGDHTYFVGNLDGGAWVHNPGPCDEIPAAYVQEKYSVDMRNAPASSPVNAAGYPRNGPWFWRQLQKTNPELFDAENTQAIARGSPKVNDQWIKYHPTHEGFAGDKLIHHHVDKGPIAVGLPDRAHKAWHGRLHY